MGKWVGNIGGYWVYEQMSWVYLNYLEQPKLLTFWTKLLRYIFHQKTTYTFSFSWCINNNNFILLIHHAGAGCSKRSINELLELLIYVNIGWPCQSRVIPDGLDDPSFDTRWTSGERMCNNRNNKACVPSFLQCLMAQPHVKTKHRVNCFIIIDRLCDGQDNCRALDWEMMGHAFQHYKVTAMRPRIPWIPITCM